MSVRINSDYLFITVFVMSAIFYEPHVAYYFFTVFVFTILARHYLQSPITIIGCSEVLSYRYIGFALYGHTWRIRREHWFLSVFKENLLGMADRQSSLGIGYPRASEFVGLTVTFSKLFFIVYVNVIGSLCFYFSFGRDIASALYVFILRKRGYKS